MNCHKKNAAVYLSSSFLTTLFPTILRSIFLNKEHTNYWHNNFSVKCRAPTSWFIGKILPARLPVLFAVTTNSKVKLGLLPQLLKWPTEQCMLLPAELHWQSALYYCRIEACACLNLNLPEFPTIFLEKKNYNKTPFPSAPQEYEY